MFYANLLLSLVLSAPTTVTDDLLRRSLIFSNQTHVFTLDKNIALPFKNPSFIRVKYPLLYVVEEDKSGSLSTINLENNGIESVKVTQPCVVSVHSDGDVAATANYGSSSVTFVKSPGLEVLLEESFMGKGSTDRQGASHPHDVVFDGGMAYVPDLGLDLIHRYQIPSLLETGITKLNPLKVESGYGPRHMVIVKDFIYLVTELNSHLVVMNKETGKVVKDIALIGTDCVGGAEIQVLGGYVYVSVRNGEGLCTAGSTGPVANAPSEAVTAKDAKGWIVRVDMKTFKTKITTLAGNKPRFFKIFGKKLYCLLEDQEFCQVFDITDNGGLRESDPIHVGLGCKSLDSISNQDA